MGIPFAEVIGDPIDHSKSPFIHKFWLEKLGLEGEYRATRVHPSDLNEYFASRRDDPDWRGCNVTQPHKIDVIGYLDSFAPTAVAVGAVNCVYRAASQLIGENTDVEGVTSVFDTHTWRANQATLIGSGGAARAALEVLRRRDTLEVFMIVRDPERDRPLHAAFARSGAVHGFDDLTVSFLTSEYVINASPLGMAGAEPMPQAVLDSLERVAEQAVVFDMVYDPVETELLRRARQLGLRTCDGLEMLVGQAAAAFELFFGAGAPREHDGELRELLIQ